MPSLVALAEELLAHAKKIETALEENDLPHTSFDHDTLELLPQDVQRSRRELVDASAEFQQLVRGARSSGLDIAFNWTEQLVLHLVWQYRLASAVPLHGGASYDQISAATGLQRGLARRIIRAAIPLHVFDEAEPGQVCHTAISRLMKESEAYNSAIGLQVEDIGPASLKLTEAWQNSDPEQSAFSIANGGRSLFTVLSEEPERASRFDQAMKYTIEDKGFDSFDITKAFDWSSLDKPGSQLIDLGGGYGQISQILAGSTHDIAFTVQDLPHVVEQAQSRLPPEFRDRISFKAHSFLEPQETNLEKAPDAFLISRCLHNWSDHHSLLILRALVPALRKGSKVLIWDAVLDDKPIKKLSEKFNLQQDFIMATVSNGKDRSAEEFKQILKSSDDRFHLQAIRRPEGCKLSLIEVTWDS